MLLDENKKLVSKSQFLDDRAKCFLDASSGVISGPQIAWLKETLPSDVNLLTESQITQGLHGSFPNAETMSEEDNRSIRRNQIELLVDSGLATSREQAEESIRQVSLEISNLRIKEMSSNPDLQAMESVQALDEIDKTANIISSRLREWYGLHFPELTSLVDDNISFAKLIVNFKSRSNYDASLLEQMGYSKAKSKAIETSAKDSRGADLRVEDIS